MATQYNDDRVSIEPAPVQSGDTVHINYQGILKNSGADQVFLHYGVDGWRNMNTVPMQQQAGGVFGAEVRATGSQELNFCFKDSADHWDSNSGWNWKVEVR